MKIFLSLKSFINIPIARVRTGVTDKMASYRTPIINNKPIAVALAIRGQIQAKRAK